MRCLALAASLLALGTVPALAQGQVNVYNWSDYIDPVQLKDFAALTKIKVNYTTYDSNEILDAKLRSGQAGYDVVVPTASPFFVRQMSAKLYQPLDKAKLGNYGNLDPATMALLAKYDPGNAHAIPWMWGTIGIGYNATEIRKRMNNAPVDSLRMIFDPATVSRFTDCGVMMLDSGDICLAFGYSGDILQAKDRAAATPEKRVIEYAIPHEGSMVWMDVAAIPKNAPNVDNAYRFLDFMMNPKVAAASSVLTNYANGNAASLALLPKSISGNKSIYPTDGARAYFYTITAGTPEQTRERTRLWTTIKTGQ